MQHISTGASVVIRGDLYVNPWITRESEALAGVHIDADSIALNLVRIEQVIFQARRRRDGLEGEGDHANGRPDDAVGPTEFDSPPEPGGTAHLSEA